MKAYERIADAFVAEGTRAIFSLVGDGNMFWLHAMNQRGVKIVDVRHEGAGLGMADGWARATREVGVATATNGPGVTQFATGLVTAARAKSPLVAFVGDSATTNPEHIQRFDQQVFAKACETEFIPILSEQNVDWAVQRAFFIARTESRPVLLSAPRDIQQKVLDDDLDPYLPSTSLLPKAKTAPSPVLIEQAAELIANAHRVVIIAGRGAMWSDAGEAVRRLAEQTGAVIASTLQSKAFLADDPYHIGIAGLYATRTAMHLCEEADVVIGVGASLNPYTTEHGYLFPKATYIQLDLDPNRGMGEGRVADILMHCDAKVGAETLVAALERRGNRQLGYRTPETTQQLVGHFADPARFDVEPGLLDPREVCDVLDELLPTDTVLHSGGGTSSAWSVMHINKPRRFMASKFWACMGQGLPSAIGATFALDRPVAFVEGDGSLIMHLAELETAVRHEIPLLAICLNDGALGSEYHKYVVAGLPPDTAICATPDLGAVMRSFGGKGTLATDIDHVRNAVKEWVANPSPTVIDARISRKVLTIPHRRVHQGEDV